MVLIPSFIQFFAVICRTSVFWFKYDTVVVEVLDVVVFLSIETREGEEATNRRNQSSKREITFFFHTQGKG